MLEYLNQEWHILGILLFCKFANCHQCIQTQSSSTYRYYLQGKLFCRAFCLASSNKRGRKTLIEFCDNKEQELVDQVKISSQLLIYFGKKIMGTCQTAKLDSTLNQICQFFKLRQRYHIHTYIYDTYIKTSLGLFLETSSQFWIYL